MLGVHAPDGTLTYELICPENGVGTSSNRLAVHARLTKIATLSLIGETGVAADMEKNLPQGTPDLVRNHTASRSSTYDQIHPPCC